MSQEPYCSASRVFWIVDNGSSHRSQRRQERLSRRRPNLIVVHTPIHASWLNPIEIYFSILQRKVLTPNHFTSLAALRERLLDFQRYYQTLARPFQWRFTRQDLDLLLHKLNACRRAA
jgi:transposase